MDFEQLEQVEVETVYMTDTAAETVRNLLIQKNVPDYGLRVFVAGGGCSGMQYGMALEAEPRNYDHIVEKDGVKVFIDPTSMMYLNQATIDYVDSIMGGGFKIENPNAVTSCGCGSSFKTQESEGYSEPAGGGCGCGH
ncbi:MAG TPA: iron-sulfur cluster insertion protein ErpA [Promineifilum sp.]|nr:iron-sulfur cluster insertion protein ErpA [Promineifilum sp.]HRO23103.1 iron-sulfur cluster insertion protein ErpA [Promineifilum sp.]HRO90613.1 iron-sulfur cluster insertion protein ErpA [Promineifilum sp.]HRQ12897.1 iron-sulfur cluster insertion protein ErpA [Promineifilum sp.]